jgi:TRAP-type C4-dicarboxylate transport system permease small subunit
MNKKAQNTFIEVLIALAMGCTGVYTIYYAFINWDMQCNILGSSKGYWCLFILILIGLILTILGFYGAYYFVRGGRGTPVPQYEY